MEKKVYYNKYDAGLCFLSAIFMPSIVAIVFMLVVWIIASIFGLNFETVSKSNIYVILSLFLTPIAFLLTFMFSNKFSKTNWKKAINVSFKLKPLNIIACVAISLICVFGVMNFVNLFDATIKSIGFKGNYDLPLPLNTFGWFCLNLLVMALLPAVFEELIFRGVIFKGLKQYGKIPAVFISAALFMLMHGGIEQTVYPFIVGIILGFVMLKTNNIIYPIITHFLNNATVLLINYISVLNPVVQTEFQFTAYNIIFAIITLIASILLICVFLKFVIRKSKNEEVVYEQNQKPNTLLYIAIGCGIIIWIFDLISGFGA